MKTIIAVLLIAALGTAAYFYFTRKQNPGTSGSNAWIAGRWKIDSVDVSHSRDSSPGIFFIISDSGLHNYRFDIDDKGLIIQNYGGNIADTGHYEWVDSQHLLMWHRGDSSKSQWTINKLNSSNFILRDKDSTVFSLTRTIQ